MNNAIIQLDRKLKIALLEAVERGTLDLSIFECKHEDMNQRDVMREIVRLEKNENPVELARLITEWATGQIDDEEYITKRLAL